MLNKDLKDDLLIELDCYLQGDSDDEDSKEFNKQRGPLFGYLYIRDYLNDTIYPEIDNEKLKTLINELDVIITGENSKFDNTYKGTMAAVDRCDSILNEIKKIIEEED